MNQNVLQNQTLTIYVDTYYISMDKDIYSRHRLPDWAQSLAENIGCLGAALIACTKGQTISKVSYLVPNSSKKLTKYLSNSALATTTEFFGSFFEELRTSKFAFEII